MTGARIDAERCGRLAETLCVIALRLTGCRIVARRGNMIAFIEVKARLNLATAVESVTAAQRARIARSAEVYLQHRPDLADCNVSFDVMILAGGLFPRRINDAWRP